jgi:hypothetical protein
MVTGKIINHLGDFITCTTDNVFHWVVNISNIYGLH